MDCYMWKICHGEPRNLANWPPEFGKICRGKLWSLLMNVFVNLAVADYPLGRVGSCLKPTMGGDPGFLQTWDFSAIISKFVNRKARKMFY